MARKPSTDEAAVPAPNDLAAWKQADSQLATRFADHLNRGERLRSPRAIWRYFDDDDVAYFFEKHEQRGVALAYSSWGMLHYRPKGGKTRAEELLAEGLPPAQAMLLKARMQAYPTLYRVAGHNPKQGTVDLEDVLLGGTVTIRDQMLSQHINNGLFLAARTFPAGQFHFFEMIGPPLGIGQGMEAIDYLQECGMVFTPAGLKRDAHKFGWLWAWSDEWEANWKPPQLRNTDGHELVFHTASFSVDDPATVRQALIERRDVNYDADVDEFTWSKPVGQNARMPGETVTLGQIALIDDELVVTVNSAERFAEARQWLTKLPGVKFIGVSTRDLQSASEDRPLDEQMGAPEPVELTPEMVIAFQDHFDRYYMDWLDAPLPMLSGKTPRQACQTPAGRDQVAMMIRTMPDPMGPAPISIPRDAMLRELGLSTQTRTQRSEPDRRGGPPSGKVRRNDPCPCGSGRKYKRCCGRQG